MISLMNTTGRVEKVENEIINYRYIEAQGFAPCILKELFIQIFFCTHNPGIIAKGTQC